MKLLLLCLVTGFWSQIASASSPASGTARILETVNDNRIFFSVRISTDREVKPGIQFYPEIRVILDDGSYIDGGLGCFPSGLGNGSESGGDVYTVGRIPRKRVIKRLEPVARIGMPMQPFLLDQGTKWIEPLNDRTLNQLLEAGGMIIRIPVEASK